MLIDTHCHLNISVKSKFDQLLTREEIDSAKNFSDAARERGVQGIVNVGTSVIESINCVALAHAYPEMVATVGVHPCDGIAAQWDHDYAALEELLTTDAQRGNAQKIVGIGECGLDYYHPGFNKEFQRKIFRAQIELALKYNKALSIHSRSAGDEVLSILEEYTPTIPRAVLHCFSEDSAAAQRARNMGIYLGIGGTITYPKNEILRTVVREVGLTGIVLETDTPYLPPQYIRGKKNSPAEIRTIAEFIGELCAVHWQDVAAMTTANAQALFKTPFFAYQKSGA